MSATDDTTLVDGVRWLRHRRVTLGVVSLLLVVFAFELVVRSLFDSTVWRYLFLAHLDPSPGWVMAPFSHRNLRHLLTTLPLIVVYGGLVEGWLTGSSYFAFYVVAGYTSTVAQLGAYLAGEPGLGTLGASGAALGLVALYIVRMVGQALWHPETVTIVQGVFAGSGLVTVATVLANDFVPWVTFTTGTAPFGHLGGILAGAAYGLVVLRAQQQSTGDTSRRV